MVSLRLDIRLWRKAVSVVIGDGWGFRVVENAKRWESFSVSSVGMVKVGYHKSEPPAVYKSPYRQPGLFTRHL
jgi:hypothetical protein